MRPATWTSRPGEAPITSASSPTVSVEPFEAQLEELSPVAAATSPLTARVGLATILVAAGAAGGMLLVGPSASHPTPEAAAVAAAPSGAETGGGRSIGVATAEATEPTEPTVSMSGDLPAVSGGAVTVEVTSPRPLGRVRVGLVVAGREVATAEADIPDAGAFPVPLTLPGVPFRVEGHLRLTWLAGMDEPRVLAETPLTVLPAAGVELLGLVETRDGTLDIEGVAPARVERVRVALMDEDDRELATAEAPVASHRAWGGTFPALGRFAASLEPEQAPEGTVRLILAWTDPWTDAEASRTTILVAEDR